MLEQIKTQDGLRSPQQCSLLMHLLSQATSLLSHEGARRERPGSLARTVLAMRMATDDIVGMHGEIIC